MTSEEASATRWDSDVRDGCDISQSDLTERIHDSEDTGVELKYDAVTDHLEGEI